MTRGLCWLVTAAAGVALSAAAVRAAETAGDAAAMAQAPKDFATYCAPCHGADGKGDGPIAGRLNIQPADLTRISQRDGGTFPAADIYNKIEGLNMPQAHGSRGMPVWGDVFVSQAVGATTSLTAARAAAQKARSRIGALVDYIRSLQTAR